ncbi:MAG: phytanoyl-CoA dioxygenase family protein [Chloroflexota bacterium]
MIQVDQLSEVAPSAPSHEIRNKFDEYGYIVVRGLFDPVDDLQPTIDEYAAVLDREARAWYAAGDLSSTYDDLPFEERMIKVMAETGDRLYDYFRIFLNPPSATKADTPLHYGPAIFDLLTNDKLLDVIEAIIGPEITVNPVNVVRVKPPERYFPSDNDYHVGLTATWWHQDQSVYSEDLTEIDMLTVWLPLTDADKDMGCLQVVPGSHKGDLSLHCAHKDPHRVGIPEMMLGPIRHYIETKIGDVHFHHRRLQHGSLRNLSDRLRFSFDLRYQPTDQAFGQSAGMPAQSMVPGFIARSPSNPEQEMRHWREWADYQEAMRQQFMAIDWDNQHTVNQFVEEHRYCI